jgi:hypothetical protein
MCIRKTDWKRVYRKIKAIPKDTNVYMIVENVAWGVCGSSILTLIPLYQAAQKIDEWLKPTFWSAAIAAATIALLSHHFGNKRGEIITASFLEIQKDMQEVFATFFSSESID